MRSTRHGSPSTAFLLCLRKIRSVLRRFWWRTVVCSGAIVVLSALAGCSSAPLAAAPLPEKNIDQWVSPFDSYVPHNIRKSDYANLLLNAKCMISKGYDWEVPWRNLDGDDGPSRNSSGRQLFNLPLASKVGYHEAAPARSSTNPQWEAFIEGLATLPPDEEAAFTTCAEEDRKTLPALDQTIANLASGYGVIAWNEATQDAIVQDAATKWRACMTSQRFAELPSSPVEMPTASMRSRFGLDSGEASTASAEELRIATADAECQESSGFRAALYEAEWRASLPLVEEHADALARAREAISRHDSEVQSIIDRNMPPPPAQDAP